MTLLLLLWFYLYAVYNFKNYVVKNKQGPERSPMPTIYVKDPACSGCPGNYCKRLWKLRATTVDPADCRESCTESWRSHWLHFYPDCAKNLSDLGKMSVSKTILLDVFIARTFLNIWVRHPCGVLHYVEENKMGKSYWLMHIQIYVSYRI